MNDLANRRKRKVKRKRRAANIEEERQLEVENVTEKRREEKVLSEK